MVTKIVVLGLLLVSISGCANVYSFAGKEAAKQRASLHEICLQSSLLVTDLTLSPVKRTYVLPNGQVCPRQG